MSLLTIVNNGSVTFSISFGLKKSMCYDIFMEIIKQLNNAELTLVLVGELNSYTAPELEAVIKNDLASVKSLIIDFEKLEYLSSAGLRVLLVAQKLMNKQGSMTLRHVNSSVMEIFTITGFSNILNIEN